jgi:hypothetical protein
MVLTNADKGSRSISVLYTPTTGNADLKVGLHFNGSSSPRPNAITSDRGDGFTTTAGSTAAVLNLQKGRSKLGDASGYARAYYPGQVDDRSAGADRHIAIAVSGQQSAQDNAVILHAMTVEGANG